MEYVTLIKRTLTRDPNLENYAYEDLDIVPPNPKPFEPKTQNPLNPKPLSPLSPKPPNR